MFKSFEPTMDKPLYQSPKHSSSIRNYSLEMNSDAHGWTMLLNLAIYTLQKTTFVFRLVLFFFQMLFFSARAFPAGRRLEGACRLTYHVGRTELDCGQRPSHRRP
ncbi:hypothetical protein HYQ45_002088 [Verticillium longisporum]|uniref:Uncharacterized protein n=1 Tax=Verticillium longisporum TaxID=100787 RepID=A0A8I2ZXW7_VERLO|nr:hypothetical protein HYQ45_002088 [Verticillium longisporum]KAG7152771.1 hypothetical protein HYQ46_006284 [Verticillium longisporum]